MSLTVRIDPFDTSCVGVYRRILKAEVGRDNILSITAGKNHHGNKVQVIIGDKVTEYDVKPSEVFNLTYQVQENEPAQKKIVKIYTGTFPLFS